MRPVCDYAEQIPGLLLPNRDQFDPVRTLVTETGEFTLFSLYDRMEDTDCHERIMRDLTVIEKIGGEPLLIHTVDQSTDLHDFYVYIQHDDPRLLATYDALIRAACPEIPAV